MKHLSLKLQLFLMLLMFVSVGVQAQKSPLDMDRFIDDLMKKMTLEEKIGQLNLPVTGEITTGQAKSSNVAKRIRAGEVGGLFNLKGVERIRDVQKQAIEESRLGIPLLFGMDVIHGYETVFPIPLGLSCTWDMEAIEESARIAAIEASADGICWTFSPMVDVSRDARWGRVSEGYLFITAATLHVPGMLLRLSAKGPTTAIVPFFASGSTLPSFFNSTKLSEAVLRAMARCSLVKTSFFGRVTSQYL